MLARRLRRAATPALVAAALSTALPYAHAATHPSALGSLRPIIERVPRTQGALAIANAVPVPTTPTGVGPGTQLFIERPTSKTNLNAKADFLCSGGFVFSSNAGLLLSAAGHCFLPSDASATNGPGADYNPASTHVWACVQQCLFGGQTGGQLNELVDLGNVVYARQNQGGQDVGWDFGLVKIPSSLTARPSMPVWGGPRGESVLALGQPVCYFGDGTGSAETFATMARAGVGIFQNATTWGAEMPSTVGDSGSAVETCHSDGTGLTGDNAVGILTHTVVGAAIIQGTTLSQARNLAAQAGVSLTLQTG